MAMRVLLVALFTLVSLSAFAQTTRRAIRVQVRHADPYAIKAMLEGHSLLAPEISVMLAFTGQGSLIGPAVNALVTDGHFIVNPGDNSLWFIPNQP